MSGQATEVAATLGPITEPQKLQRSNASKTRANPRDLTGKRKQELEAQAAQERERREAEMVEAATVAQYSRQNDVVDYSEGGSTSPSVPPAGMTPRVEEEPDEIEVENSIVEIRVNSPIEDMVFGRRGASPGDPEKGILPTPGNLQFYNFQEGVRYRVPLALAKHLDRLGYVYH